VSEFCLWTDDWMGEEVMANKLLWIQAWEESERGYGIRSDGYSMHSSKADVQKFIKKYWDSMPDAVPGSYSRPTGLPFQAEVEPGYYSRVENSTDGMRIYGWSPA